MNVPLLEKVKAIVPMISGSISWISSCALILTILKSRQRLSVTFHRIMVVMSLSDLISSFAISLGAIPCPVYSNLWLSSGNKASCEVQGFFGAFMMTTPLFNGMLCIHFLLSIKYGVSANIRKAIDPFLIIIPLIWGFFTSSYYLVTNAYNPHVGTKICWITEFPFDCDKKQDVECIRGEGSQHSFVYRTSFFLNFLVVPFVIITTLSVIHFHLRREEASFQDRILVLGGQRSIPSLSRRSLYQLLSYSGAWFVSHIFYIIVYIRSDLLKANVPLPVYFLLQVFYPLQGFLNFLVFMFPKVRTYKQRHPGICCFKAMIDVMLNRTRPLPRQQTLTTALGNVTTSSHLEGNNQHPSSIQEFTADRRFTDCETKSAVSMEENTRGNISSSQTIDSSIALGSSLNNSLNEKTSKCEESSISPPCNTERIVESRGDEGTFKSSLQTKGNDIISLPSHQNSLNGGETI